MEQARQFGKQLTSANLTNNNEYHFSLRQHLKLLPEKDIGRTKSVGSKPSSKPALDMKVMESMDEFQRLAILKSVASGGLR